MKLVDPTLPFADVIARRRRAGAGAAATTFGMWASTHDWRTLRDLYRVLYQRSGNLFVLLHALEKRTGALPQADIDVAKRRFEDFRARMEQQPRRPPRPAGHDAP